MLIFERLGRQIKIPNTIFFTFIQFKIIFKELIHTKKNLINPIKYFSLQQINQILHEKLDAQARLKSSNNNYMVDQQSCGTQTLSLADKTSCITASVCTQTEPKSPAVSPAPKSAPTKKPIKSVTSTKEETHLLATVRGMRVDLAIKEKALQRLTRELDECKKMIKKLQKENESKIYQQKSINLKNC